MISMFEVGKDGEPPKQQIMAISQDPNEDYDMDDDPFKPQKLSKAEFLMA